MANKKKTEEELLEVRAPKKDVSYSTEKELFYLSIQCGLMREVPRMSRLKHLIAYRDAMKLRSNWGTLKPDLIAQHVNMLIESNGKMGAVA